MAESQHPCSVRRTSRSRETRVMAGPSRAVGDESTVAAYRVRSTAASPWPPPPHSATAAVPPPRRRSSSSAVSATRVPDMPTGCPSAMAPPLTLTLSSSMPRSSAEARPTAAKASLISKRSMVVDVDAGLAGRLDDGPRRLGQQRVVRPGHHAVADDLAERRDAQLLGLGRRHHDDGGAAVGDLRRVARGDGAVLGEGRPQLAQRLGRRLGPHTLVGVDQSGSPLRWGTCTGDDLFGQPAVLGGAAAFSWLAAAKASWRSREIPTFSL